MLSQYVFSGGLEKSSPTSQLTKNNSFSADTVGVWLIREGNFHYLIDHSEPTANLNDQNNFARCPSSLLASQTSSASHNVQFPVASASSLRPTTATSFLDHLLAVSVTTTTKPTGTHSSRKTKNRCCNLADEVIESSNKWKVKLDKCRLVIRPTFPKRA